MTLVRDQQCQSQSLATPNADEDEDRVPSGEEELFRIVQLEVHWLPAYWLCRFALLFQVLELENRVVRFLFHSNSQVGYATLRR